MPRPSSMVWPIPNSPDQPVISCTNHHSQLNCLQCNSARQVRYLLIMQLPRTLPVDLLGSVSIVAGENGKSANVRAMLQSRAFSRGSAVPLVSKPSR